MHQYHAVHTIQQTDNVLLQILQTFTHLFGGGIDSRWALLPLELLVGELASLIIFLELLLPRSNSLRYLLPVCLIRLVLGPQVRVPAKEVAGEICRLKSLLHLRGQRGKGIV